MHLPGLHHRDFESIDQKWDPRNYLLTITGYSNVRYPQATLGTECSRPWVGLSKGSPQQDPVGPHHRMQNVFRQLDWIN